MQLSTGVSKSPNSTFESTTRKARYIGFDMLKLLCSFLVVYIHIPMPGIVGDLIYSLARIAVPIFFMITGFFYESTVGRNGVKKQIKKIFLLFVYANSIFFFGNCFEVLLYGNSLGEYIHSTVNSESLLDLFVFNVSPWGVHLWYLGAILYTLLIMAVVFKPSCKKILWAFIPFLISTDLLLGQYSKLFFGKTFPIHWVRNFLFVGIPYFLIGNLIFSHKDIVLKRFTSTKAGLLVIVFTITTFFEMFLLNTNNLSTARNHYISTTCLAVSVFLLFQSSIIKQTKFTDCLASISRSCTTWIYILHPLFITALNIIVSFLRIKNVFKYVGCVVVYLCVTIFILVIQIMINRLKGIPIQKSNQSV